MSDDSFPWADVADLAASFLTEDARGFIAAIDRLHKRVTESEWDALLAILRDLAPAMQRMAELRHQAYGGTGWLDEAENKRAWLKHPYGERATLWLWRGQAEFVQVQAIRLSDTPYWLVPGQTPIGGDPEIEYIAEQRARMGRDLFATEADARAAILESIRARQAKLQVQADQIAAGLHGAADPPAQP